MKAETGLAFVNDLNELCRRHGLLIDVPESHEALKLVHLKTGIGTGTWIELDGWTYKVWEDTE